MVRTTTTSPLAPTQTPPNEIANGQYVFCAGMPRSGSTWQYQVVSHLLEQQRGAVRGGFLEHLEDFERIEEQTAGRVPWLTLKTHNGHPPYARALTEGRALAVYSYRDLRDVAFSLAHKMGQTFAEVVDKKFMLEQCLDDHRFWTALPNVLCQRYEDVIRDPVGGVKEIAAFLKVPLTGEEAERLAEMYSLEANRARAHQLANKLRETGVDLDQPNNALLHDEHSQLHWNHIRQGHIGGWRDEATPEQLVVLAKLCAGWLIENGYEKDANWVQPGLGHLVAALEDARRDLRLEHENYERIAQELGEIKTLGPLAMTVASAIQRVVSGCPRFARPLKRTLRWAGFKSFDPEVQAPARNG